MAKLDTEPFKIAVRREFAFLIDELGFAEIPAPEQMNEFSVWFANDATRLVVESINWGLNARVALGRSGAVDAFENYDLLDYVAVHSPESQIDAESRPAGALNQLAAMATILREHAAPVLQGDFALFASVQKIVDRRSIDLKKNR